MVIAAYAGTGKTTLAKHRPNEFVDFVCMPYKYELPEHGGAGEAGKANPDHVLRDDWPYNYADAIQMAAHAGKHLLIPSDLSVLMLLQIKGAPYTICYPQRSAKDEYLRRYRARGNTQAFMDIFIGRWDRFLDALERDLFGRHVVLRPHEYLADVAASLKETAL
jgi:hypothetical protein